MATAADTEDGMEGRLSFNDFIRLLEQAGPAGPLEGPDPQVMETRSAVWLGYRATKNVLVASLPTSYVLGWSSCADVGGMLLTKALK